MPSQQCLLLNWNSIPTCPPIQTICWHKHPLKSTPPFPPTSPLHDSPSSGTGQVYPEFYSTIEESHVLAESSHFSFIFKSAVWKTPGFSQEGSLPFSPLYPFILFHIPRFSFYLYNLYGQRSPWVQIFLTHKLLCFQCFGGLYTTQESKFTNKKDRKLIEFIYFQPAWKKSTECGQEV